MILLNYFFELETVVESSTITPPLPALFDVNQNSPVDLRLHFSNSNDKGADALELANEAPQGTLIYSKY